MSSLVRRNSRCAEEDAEAAITEIVGCHDIGTAIVVEIGDGDLFDHPPDIAAERTERERVGRLEQAVAISQNDFGRAVGAIGNDEIEVAVAIDIGDREQKRAWTAREYPLRFQGPVPVSQNGVTVGRGY